MTNLDTLASILSNLRGYLKKLTILAELAEHDFVRDFTKVESAKHLLQVSIECCLDIAHHIVADRGYRTPANYYETFVVLHENDILPEGFLPTLRQMVSFRNRVVHLYWEVDDAIVYQTIRENLGAFEVYIGYILDFLKQETADG